MAKHKKKPDPAPRILNRRARHDYHILDSLEVGVVLQGSEVKSVRAGQVSLGDGFARIDPKSLEMFLHDVDIARYAQGGSYGHDAPKQVRKLLAHRREINKLLTQTSSKGATLIPLAMYFSDRGRVKIELGVGVGKKAHDKRESIKERESKREIDRAMSRRRR